MVTCCCPVCGCGPIRVVHLYRHLRSAHNWTEEQIDEEEMAMKAKTLAQKGNHKCGACDKTFVNDQGCSRHWKVAHKGVQRFSGNYVVCPSCQQKFQNSAQLVKHWREEHEQEEDQSVDPNFVLAFLNRTLRQLDCMERRNQPLISNPGWRWRGKKKVSKVPQVQEKEVHDPTQVPQVQMKEVHDSSAGELLFDSAVKQEAPGPSHVPPQSGSELQMADEGHSDDSSGSSDQSGDGQMLGTSRRSRSSETPEEEAARRRFKAERERIRRYQTKLLKEKQRDMAIHAYEAMRNAPPHVAQVGRYAMRYLIEFHWKCVGYVAHKCWSSSTKCCGSKDSERSGVAKCHGSEASERIGLFQQVEVVVAMYEFQHFRAACYALVGLSSESERQKFVDVAVSNGFCDLMFMKGPIGNALDGVQLLYLNTSGVAPRPQEKAATKVEVNGVFMCYFLKF
ncbi:zinc finger, C2H2 type [Cooperia oncophora]